MVIVHNKSFAIGMGMTVVFFTILGLIHVPPLHWRWLFWTPSLICAVAGSPGFEPGRQPKKEIVNRSKINVLPGIFIMIY